MSAPRTNPSTAARPQPWLFVLLIFAVTSLVETIGVGHILAFLPLYLRHLGLPEARVPTWTGVLFSLNFAVGLPLVPFWGVWADRYGRRPVIARSAFVEMAVFGAGALARTPLQLAFAILLMGFQLGNTGIMLAALRSVTPPRRVGLATALMGAMGPVGLAIGPAAGGWLIDHTGWSIASLLTLDAALSLGTGLLILLALREARPEGDPTTGSAWSDARAAVRSVITVPVTRWLFLTYLFFLFGRQMFNPFLPLIVQRLHPGSAGLATAIGTVVGTAGLVGALLSPVSGALGDWFGYRRVLAWGIAGAAMTVALMPFAPTVGWLSALNGLASASGATLTAMLYALLATVVPEERRAATLNLALVPLYLGGIFGPALAAVLSLFSLTGVLLTAAAVIALALFSQRQVAAKAA